MDVMFFEEFCVNACKPWNSPYYGEAERIEAQYGSDDQDAIEKCINCPYSACIDCLNGKKIKYDRVKLFDLIAHGLGADEICRTLKIPPKTVYQAQEEYFCSLRR